MKLVIRSRDGGYRIGDALHNASATDIVVIEYHDHEEIILFNINGEITPYIYQLNVNFVEDEIAKLYKLHDHIDLTFLSNESTTSEIIIKSNIDDILKRFEEGENNG